MHVPQCVWDSKRRTSFRSCCCAAVASIDAAVHANNRARMAAHRASARSIGHTSTIVEGAVRAIP